jgi:hypothetical protein
MNSWIATSSSSVRMSTIFGFDDCSCAAADAAMVQQGRMASAMTSTGQALVEAREDNIGRSGSGLGPGSIRADDAQFETVKWRLRAGRLRRHAAGRFA